MRSAKRGVKTPFSELKLGPTTTKTKVNNASACGFLSTCVVVKLEAPKTERQTGSPFQHLKNGQKWNIFLFKLRLVERQPNEGFFDLKIALHCTDGSILVKS